MDAKIILTIGRQFGSGGREIGKKLAKSLGIAYYDKELLAEAAKESGLCEDVFAKADERTSHGLAYAFQNAEQNFVSTQFLKLRELRLDYGVRNRVNRRDARRILSRHGCNYIRTVTTQSRKCLYVRLNACSAA